MPPLLDILLYPPQPITRVQRPGFNPGLRRQVLQPYCGGPSSKWPCSLSHKVLHTILRLRSFINCPLSYKKMRLLSILKNGIFSVHFHSSAKKRTCGCQAPRIFSISKSFLKRKSMISPPAWTRKSSGSYGSTMMMRPRRRSVRRTWLPTNDSIIF